MQLTGVLSIGLLIAIAFLELDSKGRVVNLDLVKKAKRLLSLWLTTTFIYILVQIAYLLDQPITASFDLTVIRSYLTQTSIGKSYLLQIIGILVLFLQHALQILLLVFLIIFDVMYHQNILLIL